MWSLLGDYGKGKFLDDIRPSMYRVHENGVHSLTHPDKQLKMRLETIMALFSFRLKKGHSELAEKHLEDIVVLGVKLLRWKILSVFVSKFFKTVSRGFFRR
jgi:hypothetical protein